MTRHTTITIIKAGVTLTALAILASRIDLSRVGDAVRSFPITWIPTMACLLIASLLFSTLKWQLVLKGLGQTVDLLHLTRLFWVGQFFNTFLPGRTGGDIVRAVSLSGSQTTRSRAITSVAIDRGTNLLALATIAALAAISDVQLPGHIRTVVWLTGTTAVVAACLLVAGRHRVVQLIPERYRDGLEALVPADLVGVPMARIAVLAISVQILMIVTNIAAARAMGLSISGLALFTAIPITAIITALPVSINGLGVREVAYAGLLSYFGIAPEEAVALSLVMTATIVGWSLIGGLLYVSVSGSGHQAKETVSVLRSVAR